MSAAAIVALGGLAALIVGLVFYERTRGGARELGLVAVLVAAATAGRIAFAAIPSAQPVTAIAIVTGVALGPRAGAAVGAGARRPENRGTAPHEQGQHRHAGESERRHPEIGLAPADGFHEMLDHRRPDGAGEVVAAGAYRHRDAAAAHEP
jgi:hypothetical protein